MQYVILVTKIVTIYINNAIDITSIDDEISESNNI